jgi:hypothetical protein
MSDFGSGLYGKNPGPPPRPGWFVRVVSWVLSWPSRRRDRKAIKAHIDAELDFRANSGAEAHHGNVYLSHDGKVEHSARMYVNGTGDMKVFGTVEHIHRPMTTAELAGRCPFCGDFMGDLPVWWMARDLQMHIQNQHWTLVDYYARLPRCGDFMGDRPRPPVPETPAEPAPETPVVLPVEKPAAEPTSE